jgi:hypothetical protein
VNANHIFDTLANEYPERIIDEAQQLCHRNKASKGKRYERYVEHEDQPQYDESGKVVMVLGTSKSGYRLVDE